MTGNRTACVFVTVIVSPTLSLCSFFMSLEHKHLPFKLYVTRRSKRKTKRILKGGIVMR